MTSQNSGFGILQALLPRLVLLLRLVLFWEVKTAILNWANTICQLKGLWAKKISYICANHSLTSNFSAGKIEMFMMVIQDALKLTQSKSKMESSRGGLVR